MDQRIHARCPSWPRISRQAYQQRHPGWPLLAGCRSRVESVHAAGPSAKGLSAGRGSWHVWRQERKSDLIGATRSTWSRPSRKQLLGFGHSRLGQSESSHLWPRQWSVRRGCRLQGRPPDSARVDHARTGPGLHQEHDARCVWEAHSRWEESALQGALQPDRWYPDQ